MSKQVVVDNLLTHYVQSGSGPDMLLLHGWADSKETFTNLQRQLAKSYRVTAVDLPGFGKTQEPPTAWDLSDYADFIKSFTNKVQIKPRVVLGHSNGGALTVYAAAHQKLKPQQLLLLAPSGVRDIGGKKRAVIQVITKIGKVLTFWMPRSARRSMQKRLYGTVGSDMLVSPHMKETFKKTVRQDIQGEASEISLPTLLIYGKDDKATPADSIGQRLHELVGHSELHVLDNAGHFVHHDSPDEVNRIIMEFLQ